MVRSIKLPRIGTSQPTVAVVSFYLFVIVCFKLWKSFDYSYSISFALVDYVLVVTPMLYLLIWLALGRQHMVFRFCFGLLAIVGVFALTCLESLAINVQWSDEWIFFLGNETGAMMIFTVPTILVTTTLPLMILRYFSRGSKDETDGRLSLGIFLASMACICIAIAIIAAIVPYSNWMNELPHEVFNFIDTPVPFIVTTVLPTITLTTFVYFSVALWWRFRDSYALMLFCSIGISAGLALFNCGVANFAWHELHSTAKVGLEDIVWQDLSFKWNEVFSLTVKYSLTLIMLSISITMSDRSFIYASSDLNDDADMS